MTGNELNYYSFLLRLWRVADHDQPVWRASLEEPSTGKRIGFTDLDALFTFLRGVSKPAVDGEIGDDPRAAPIPRQPSDATPTQLFPPEEVPE